MLSALVGEEPYRKRRTCRTQKAEVLLNGYPHFTHLQRRSIQSFIQELPENWSATLDTIMAGAEDTDDNDPIYRLLWAYKEVVIDKQEENLKTVAKAYVDELKRQFGIDVDKNVRHSDIMKEMVKDFKSGIKINKSNTLTRF